MITTIRTILDVWELENLGHDETQQWSNQLLFKTKLVLTVSNTKDTKGISSSVVYFFQLRPSV